MARFIATSATGDPSEGKPANGPTGSSPVDLPASLPERRRHRWRWLPLILVVLFVAAISLARLGWERNFLFWFRLPVDREPFPTEYDDGAKAARFWIAPALCFLLSLGIVTMATANAGPVATARRFAERIQSLGAKRPILLSAFALACLADWYTTWAYAQRLPLEDELHPGIRLVAYAYGLTIGITLAKAIQACLVLIVAARFPAAGRTMLLVTTAGYGAAAAWNYHWL